MKTKLQILIKFSLSLVLSVMLQTVGNAQETAFNFSQMTKYLNGVQTSEDLNQRTDIAVVSVKDVNNAYYFTSDQAFEAWAESQPGGAAVASRNKALNSIYNYALTHGYLELEEGAPIPADLQQFINQVLPVPPTTAVLSCKFYDSPNLTGASKFCVGPVYPSLGSFRNKAESVAGAGGGLASFCDHRWFGGKKVHIPFIAFFSVQNFNDMNNRIESYFSN